MKLKLTNMTDAPVPVSSEDEGGWAVQLEPRQQQEIDRPGSDVWVIGDKPGHLENIERGIKTVLGALLFWRDQRAQLGAAALHVELVNSGDKGVRIVPGNVENEQNVEAGNVSPVHVTSRDGYIELRELGA